MVKLCLIGFGKRMINYNLPVLKQLNNQIEIVGITTKSGKIASGHDMNCPVYNCPVKMCEEQDPDLMYMSTPHSQTSTIISRIVDFETPILVDTPISFNPNEILKIKMESMNYDTTIAVVEDWIRLPMECLKHEIIKSGVLGDIFTVENDYRTYDYHGIAQLRSYLPKNAVPVDIKQIEAGYPIKRSQNNDLSSFIENEVDAWKITTARMSNGSLFINKYSSLYKKVAFRGFKSLRVYGTRGSIISGCLTGSNFEMQSIDKSGVKTNIEMNKKYENDQLKCLSCTINQNEIRWDNPYTDMNLSEFQIGIMYHIDSMLQHIENDSPVIYDVGDFYEDMKLFYGQNQ